MGAFTRGALRHVDSDVLFVRWQQGRDVAARDELFARFEPLARKLARRYVGREPFDDLMQVASLALVKAIDRFDPDRGTAFSSLAVPTILGELKRYFRDVGWFAHVPRGMKELAMKVQEGQRQLSDDEWVARPPPTISRHISSCRSKTSSTACTRPRLTTSTSFDVPFDDGREEGATLLDTFGAEDERFEHVEDAMTIAGSLRGLTVLERRVLAMYFLDEFTQVQIAEQIGVSQMQVSRILRRATDRLRELTVPEGDGIR